MNWTSPSEMSLTQRQFDIAKKTALYLIGYVVIASALYSIVDIYYADEGFWYLASAVAVWGLGYVLLVLLMQASGPGNETNRSNIWGYLGLNLLAGIAIIFGLLLLILPGLFLLLRWLPAYARLYASGKGISEALNWSWHYTSPHRIALAVAMIGPLACYAVLFALAFYSEYGTNPWINMDSDLGLVVINTLTSIAVAWLQLLGVVAYRWIESQPNEAIETFI